MNLHFAAARLDVFSRALHYFVYVFLLSTAFVLKYRSSWSPRRCLASGVFWVIPTVRKLVELKCVRTLGARKHVEVSPNLPIYLFPRNPVSFSDKGDEFFEIPFSVNGMLCFKPSLSIDECSSFRASQKLSLTPCEQTQAVTTSVKVVLFLLE